MAPGRKSKICPLLVKCGIEYGDGTANKDEVRICQRCPLDHCVYDYAGGVTTGDSARLKFYYEMRVKESGKLWWRV